ncbi:MAG: acetaldehyde dehydrogenase (acetylating) [Ignavibacteriales bacterium]|nr:acetaldehyde dehydrogenase (acetylating) [Ignavibacteriales bacterium]
MATDKDLISIQEARDLAKAAKQAQMEFKHYTQEQVDKISKAMADAGYAAAETLAKMAVEESGFGNYKDKIIKNQFGTKNVYESIKDLKSVGVIATEANGKILKIAEPMGVVAALVPSTNPTSTAMYKILISLKCRNAIVLSPHPRTVNCTSVAAKILSDAAEKAGAPKGLIQCMKTPTVEGTEALMRDRDVAITLATGSNPMVKAAYSSGKPAYGVGAGNVPAFIEKTANYKKAVADIIYGTTFDNGTLCSSEQSIICDRTIADKVVEECKSQGGYFVAGQEKERLGKLILKDGRINPEIVGKAATWIAAQAGIKVPETTRVLIAECEEVGKQEPLSVEKLSPILAFYRVDGWLEGCHKCIDLLHFGGVGHTMVIHSGDMDIIMKFALEKPAFRILVNTVSSIGAVGYTTALAPALTLGPGTWGGSIISENVTAKHMMNVKHVAFETNPINPGNTINSAKMQNTPHDSYMHEIEERLKARAGNPVYTQTFTHAAKEPVKTQKDGFSFGNNLSEDDVKKIMNNFKF